MKKWIFTIMLGLAAFNFSNAQTVLFNPDTINEAYLPAGMSIDNIDGTNYLRVILNGWNSSINIPKIDTWEGNGVMATVKYSMCGETDTLTLSQINSGFKFMDTVNKVYDQWAANHLAPSAAPLVQSPTKEGFQLVTGVFDTAMKELHQIQFWGQQTVSWGPTVGDTMWVGKATTYDASVMFDPATYPVDKLPSNMEIVDDAGTKLLKITIDDWNNMLTLVPTFKMNLNNQIDFKAKVEVGTSGLTLADLNYWIGGNNTTGVQQFTGGGAGSATLADVTVAAKANIELGQLQFTIQQNSGTWPAATGAILYIGKITVRQVVDVSLDPRVTYTAPYTLGETITTDGLQMEDAWLEAAGAPADQAVTAEGFSAPASAEDNSALWYSVYDSKYLYVFVEVTDNIIVPMTTVSNQWMNDGFELYLDIKDRRYANKRLTGEQHQIRFNVERTSADLGAFGDYDDSTKFGDVKGSTTYAIEVALPWAGICQGAVDSIDIANYIKTEIKGGKKIAFEINVIDADVLDARKSILNWSNNTGEDQSYTNSEFYGQIILGASSSVKEVNNLKAHIYPNPASDNITIVMDNMNSVSVYDITGREVMSKVVVNSDITSIDVNSLTTGVYVVKVSSSTGNSIQKVNIK